MWRRLISFSCLFPLASAAPLEYAAPFVRSAPTVDGDLSDAAWKNVAWSKDFCEIRGGDQPAPKYRTRMKMLWTADALHIAAEMIEPHIWGTLTEKNSIIFHDNDFEIFLDPDGDTRNYYEFEINALGTIWELTLDKPYSKGGIARHGTNLPGLKSAVRIDGILNDPTDTDRCWKVEVAIPWKDLAPYRGGTATAPTKGDVWRINFSRVEWPHEIKDGKYVRIPPHGAEIKPDTHPENNWVWSPQEVINMHVPEKWGRLVFTP
jgi:hypothetical protein